MPPPPEIAARGFILHDLGSQQTLAVRQPDQAVPPASLTKLMTAYLVYQAVDAGQLRLEDTLPVSERAWQAAIGSGARALAAAAAGRADCPVDVAAVDFVGCIHPRRHKGLQKSLRHRPRAWQ